MILGDCASLDRRGGMNIWMEAVPFNGGDSPIELPIAEWVDTGADSAELDFAPTP